METIGNREVDNIEKLYTDLLKECKNVPLNYKQAGKLLGKKSSVISQYVQAGVVSAIQQGISRYISMPDIKILEACFYLAENYGMSYAACKLTLGLLAQLDKDTENYAAIIKKAEKIKNITVKDRAKHVNSYRSRGVALKKKIAESSKNSQNN